MGAVQQPLRLSNPEASVPEFPTSRPRPGIAPTPPFAPPQGWGRVQAGGAFDPRTGASLPRLALLPTRCAEKGCVFPASGPGGWCLHHERQRLEPSLYHSRQPTSLVIARAKFGPAKEEPELEFRQRDRRRLAVQREAFLND